MSTRLLLLICVATLLMPLGSCKTGVEPSPAPGIVRVTLKANENDTTIIIRGDTTRFSRWDEFNLFISQGRVYRGDNYALIFMAPGLDRINSDTVNIIAREWLTGVPITTADTAVITAGNSRYRKYTIFESYLPPGTYDNLQFGLAANEMRTFIPKIYQNPVQLPAGALLVMDFPLTLTINEGRVTQVDIEVLPFASLSRYRDSFLFDRRLQIVRIQLL